jgi:ribonuclease-3
MSRRPKADTATAATQATDPAAGKEPLRRRSAAAVVPAAVEAEAEAGPASAAKDTRRLKRRGAGVLEERIGYRFKDPKLLDHALTHISAVAGPRNRGGSYQRLEFLGDHVLGLVISDMLFRAFPKADEGELSRRLAELVREEACAEVARAMDLGTSIRLGASESNAGGRNRATILGDACEAVIGAVYLDGGYGAAEELVTRFWEERMRAPVRSLRDPKSMLQEWAHARALPTPVYREVARTGPAHDPEFRISVVLPNRDPAEGIGRSKRAAEQAAAAAMLAREGVETERRDG